MGEGRGRGQREGQQRLVKATTTNKEKLEEKAKKHRS
jgi:hypothetical protein